MKARRLVAAVTVSGAAAAMALVVLRRLLDRCAWTAGGRRCGS